MDTNEPKPTAEPSPTAPQRKRSKLKIALVALAVLACVGVAAFLAYASDSYHDLDANHRNLVSTEQMPVEQGDNYLAFGDPAADVGIILYPGAKVEFSSYAPLMRDLADRGYFAVVMSMPFNFAFFHVNAADGLRASFPDVESWWVGGHSLGGSMAAQYAADHAGEADLNGVVLLGSYTAADLANTDLGVISIYGSNDGVLNREKLAESASMLPADAETVEIDGGNHASFGTYGPQSGDGEASITPGEQQEITADAIDAFIRQWRAERGLANAEPTSQEPAEAA